ncbi:MAG: aspartate--tRNA ligase [Myxococcota bacterium]|nr:aspartate--tRNA ligase [Myxococcota bacterium]
MGYYRTHNCSELNASHVGQEVTLSGWMANKRDKGGILFIALRDHYGLTQLTLPNSNPHYTALSGLRVESTIRIEGVVVARPQSQINTNMETGEIEVDVKAVRVLAPSDILPFPIVEEPKVGEAIRLQNRFLDLRRSNLHKNIVLRSQVISFIRRRMTEKGFLEIQTPILTVSSPEGARDYLVPSRVHPGKFYALPQAPQQFKQLLMTSGFDRYFQIAPCFRDEDGRADRSPGEFYQLDLEMAFVTQDEVFAAVEGLMIEVFEQFSDWKVEHPFPRIPFREAMRKYGSDKPDLRFGMELQDVSELLRNSQLRFISDTITNGGTAQALVVPNVASQSNKFFKNLDKQVRGLGGGGVAWIAFPVSGAPKGSLVKGGNALLSDAEMDGLKALPEFSEGCAILIFTGADVEKTISRVGLIRYDLGNKLGLAEDKVFKFCWIVDFPMYEWNEDEERIDFSHNPFSMPQGEMDALQNKDPLDILAWQYDIVCNGVELSSGAIRNHRPDIMVKAFEIAGYNKKDVEEKFGGMFRAFQFGPPPHGGLAPGIDRIVMLLANEPNIREVIPFPMNLKAQDLLMGAPSEVSQEQLDELSIRVVFPEDDSSESDE